MDDNDIRIGPNEVINWVDLDYSDAPQTYDAGHLFTDKTEPFWQRLESDCVAGCCGIRAFYFAPDDIRDAATLVDAVALKNMLMDVREYLVYSKDTIVDVERMNQRFEKGVFLQLLDHLLLYLV